MEHLVPARLLIEELVREGQLEVRRAEIVGRDLAKLVQELGRLPSGPELEEWLEQHRMVSELYASAAVLEEALHRHFSRPSGATAASELEDAPAAGTARDAELEELLRESPDDVERYLVYSDWLQERADPLGELIALGVAATDGPPDAYARFARYLGSHEDRFLGPLARQLPRELTLGWRYGLVHRIETHAPVDPQVWRQLLDLRVCELLHELKVSLRRYRAELMSDLLSALVARAARTLRVLCFEDFEELTLPEALFRRQLSELALLGGVAILPALPASIERLRLRVRGILGAETGLRWEIRELETSLPPAVAEQLPRVALERLERLTVDLRGSSPEALVRVLEATRTPALSHLELRGRRLDQDAFRVLAGAPVARELRSLALTHLELDDERMEALAAERSHFPSLARLDVSYNELSREGLEAARRLAPEIVSQRQDRPGTAAQARLRRFAGSRLQAAEAIADPKAWRDSGIEGELTWARYRGNAEYELFVSRELDAYGCSCPSSIQPCKHVVALVLVAQKTPLVERPSGGIADRVRRFAFEDE